MALDRANEAHQEALDLYREAQSPVPSIDVAKLSQDAQQIKEEVGKGKTVTLCRKIGQHKEDKTVYGRQENDVGIDEEVLGRREVRSGGF